MLGGREPPLVHAFRAISEATDYAVVMLDPTGRIASWSSAAQRLLRRPAGEVLGERAATVLSTYDSALERDLALAASGGQPDHEVMIVRGDGSTFVARVLLTAAHGAADELAGYVLVVRVASATSGERRAPTLAEKYAEALTHADVVLKSIRDGVCVQDPTGRLLYANDSAARLCGFADADEMRTTSMSKVLESFEVTTQDGAPVAMDRLPGRAVFTQEAPPAPLLVHVRARTTGASWWVEIHATAIRDALGQPELAVSFWHDVTVREDFSSVAGEELGAPLADLALGLATLKRELGADRRVALVDESLARTARLAQVVDELRDASRVAHGTVVLERAHFDLAELTRDVARRFRDAAAAAGCMLTVDAPASVRGTWDLGRLDQVASNLLRNALEHGRGTPISIACHVRDGEAWLVVRDGGLGRAKSDRLVSTSTGLWIARRLVHAHGGRVHFVGAPGAGAEVSVVLPLA